MEQYLPILSNDLTIFALGMYCEYHNVKIRPEEQIGAHFQSLWELDLVLTGSGVRFIDGRKDDFSCGDIVLLPPDVEHQWIFNDTDTDCNGYIHNISLLFSNQFINNLTIALPDLGHALTTLIAQKKISVFHGETRDKIEALLVSMIDMTPEQKAVKMPELMLLLCSADGTETIHTRQRLKEADKRAEKLTVYCICNFKRDINIASAARHLGINKSALCRFVKQHFGATFTAYINNLRLEESCKLLKTTDKSISVIAYECGFNNITYFNRLFKMRHHKSPREYRCV